MAHNPALLQFPFKQFGLYIDLGGKKPQMVREKM